MMVGIKSIGGKIAKLAAQGSFVTAVLIVANARNKQYFKGFEGLV